MTAMGDRLVSPLGLQACCITSSAPGSLSLHFQVTTGTLMGAEAWEPLLPVKERKGRGKVGLFHEGMRSTSVRGSWSISALVSASLGWNLFAPRSCDPLLSCYFEFFFLSLEWWYKKERKVDNDQENVTQMLKCWWMVIKTLPSYSVV